VSAQASPPRPKRERRARSPRANERRELVRNALIDSRLTPNTISLTGLALNLRRRGAGLASSYFFLGGVAFIVGSIMDTLDGRYSRMSARAPRSARSSTRRSTAARRGSC
jgi:CDP-diacylglycerol--glycerol-3-phosphate 3-phosphatidyltransferase